MCAKIKSPDEFNSLLALADYFKDEKTCLKYLEESIHGDDLRCPDCGFDGCYKYKCGIRFRCKNCKRGFTAKIGTIFEGSKLPLRKWFMAMYLIGSNKKGVSSCALARELNITQKTAWYMAHKIRTGFIQEDVKLEGVVSSDEAVVGGRNGNRHKAKRLAYSYGRNFKDKVPVLGMMEKEGKVKTIVLPSMANKHIRFNVLNTVKRGSVLVTDEYGAYKTMGRYYEHHTNNHMKGQYISKEGYSSNNIEGFWSHLKRMIIGVYHRVTRKYLQRYCDELTFRFNTRTMNNGERLKLIFTLIRKPITYKQLISSNG